MPLNRVRVALTGVSGLPGVATFHFGSSVTDMGALRTFWDGVKATFPNAMVISVPNTGDTINEDTGQIQGAWSGPAQTNVIGTGGATGFSSTAGCMVRWSTPQVINGRRPIGKTFLVPAVASIFSTSGTISSAHVTICQTAASALIVAYAGELKVYHRPVAGHGGVGATVTVATVPSKQVVMRSRRD